MVRRMRNNTKLKIFTHTFYFLILTLFMCLFTGYYQASANEKRGSVLATERTDGRYYTIYDENRNIIHQTADRLYVGDEYITNNNLRYRIIKIEGDSAYARFVGKEPKVKIVSLAATTGQNRTIAIYHTHSDESYVPTDGTHSIYANGGIFKVGDAFANRLRSLGYNVVHSRRPHDPHDANAYYRSRRTAVQLLQKQPLALIDVHRDAVPPQVYSTVIKGKPVTKVKFVVGRENPRMNANLQFAKELKAAIDKTHPGLIQGILISRADFNQDIAPRSILIEVGAHTNSRYAAQSGIALFADALPKVLGGVSGVKPAVPRSNKGDWSSLFWGVLLIGGAIAGFLFFNTGSWSRAWTQFKNFFRIEFFGKNKGGK